MYVALILSYAICSYSFHLYLFNSLSVCANCRVVCCLFLRHMFIPSKGYVLFHLKQPQLSSYQGILMII